MVGNIITALRENEDDRQTYPR